MESMAGPGETNWVVKGHVLCGPHPGRLSTTDLVKNLTTLLRAGVTTFVCLQDEMPTGASPAASGGGGGGGGDAPHSTTAGGAGGAGGAAGVSSAPKRTSYGIRVGRKDGRPYFDDAKVIARAGRLPQADALRFLLTTEKGKAALKEEAKAVWEEHPRDAHIRFKKTARLLNPFLEWQMLIDEVKGSSWMDSLMIYFNEETGGKTYVAEDGGITRKEARALALDQYSGREALRAFETVEENRPEVEQRLRERQAAKTILALWRSNKCKRLIRKLYKTFVVKRVDAATGEMYYYDLRNQSSTAAKPIILGGDDCDPPPAWVVRAQLDEHDPTRQQIYFQNRLQPWINVWECPAGLVVCARCGFDFARRYCKLCARDELPWFCFDCYFVEHRESMARLDDKSGHLTAEDSWEEVEVVPHICTACGQQPKPPRPGKGEREDGEADEAEGDGAAAAKDPPPPPAECICLDCDGLPMFCLRCFRMIHMRGKRARHRSVALGKLHTLFKAASPMEQAGYAHGR